MRGRSRGAVPGEQCAKSAQVFLAHSAAVIQPGKHLLFGRQSRRQQSAIGQGIETVEAQALEQAVEAQGTTAAAIRWREPLEYRARQRQAAEFLGSVHRGCEVSATDPLDRAFLPGSAQQLIGLWVAARFDETFDLKRGAFRGAAGGISCQHLQGPVRLAEPSQRDNVHA